MAPGDDFVWIGPSTGTWSTPSNWDDTTTGQDPSPVAPNGTDDATFDSTLAVFQTIEGTGAASLLTLNGDNAVLGTIIAGNVSIGAGNPEFGTLEVGAGGTLVADSLTVAAGYGIVVSGAGAVLRITGAAELGTTLFEGGLTASVGAQVQLGDLSIGEDQTVAVDATSSIEIGAAGDATVGALTVDQGAELAATSSGDDIVGTVVDDGMISVAAFLAFSGGSLSGSGAIDVGNNAALYFEESVTGSLAIQLGSKAEIVASGKQLGNVPAAALGAGVAITLAGTGDVVELGGGPFGSTGGIGSIAGSIFGFGATDALVANNATVTGVAFSGGTLSLLDGATTVSTVLLAGDFSGETFAAYQVFNSLAEITVQPPGSGTLSAGTSTQDDYVWAGAVAGDWATAANWQDVSTGADPATIAPGMRDQVTFDSGIEFYQLIEGLGRSQALFLNGDNVVLGTIATGTLEIGAGSPGFATLQVGAGGTLAADTATSANGYAVEVLGTGAALDVLGSLVLDSSFTGGLYVDRGGEVQAGSLNVGDDQSVVVDATSSAEIGTLGGATLGALTVDPGATLSVTTYGAILASTIVNNGVVAVTQGSASMSRISGDGTIALIGGTVTFGGNVTGSVGILLDAGADIKVASGNSTYFEPGVTLGSGVGVTLVGNGDTIQLGTDAGDVTAPLGVIAGTITGFGTTDVLVTEGETVTGVYFSDGLLSLLDGVSTVGRVNLAGDFTGYTFSAEQVAATVTRITETVACYCRGTRIMTPDGEVPIEQLRIGDHVVTAAGPVRPIIWIGARCYAGRFAARNPAVMPVLIRAGALADGVPRRDLLVSPQHAMLIDGLLVPAIGLVNGVSIVRMSELDHVAYLHIELESHDAILAEGAASESFVDDDSRMLFHNAADFVRRYPERRPVAALYCAPRLEEGFALEAIRRRLASRAGLDPAGSDFPLRGFVERAGPGLVAGWAQNPLHPEVPVCLDILVDGMVVAEILANRYRADLAAAGLGSGHHAFTAAVPACHPAAAIMVRRSSDQAMLALAPGRRDAA